MQRLKEDGAFLRKYGMLQITFSDFYGIILLLMIFPV